MKPFERKNSFKHLDPFRFCQTNEICFYKMEKEENNIRLYYTFEKYDGLRLVINKQDSFEEFGKRFKTFGAWRADKGIHNVTVRIDGTLLCSDVISCKQSPYKAEKPSFLIYKSLLGNKIVETESAELGRCEIKCKMVFTNKDFKQYVFKNVEQQWVLYEGKLVGL